MWNKEETKLLKKLTAPRKVQDFLDNIPYSTDSFYRSPRRVMQDKRAHCFDGALFAAAALQFNGFPPLIVDLLARNDDEHMLAIFKVHGNLGAIAKSNFTGLRFREPVFKNLRELVISYFEDYYNLNYEKTLVGYTVPLNLDIFNHLCWTTSDKHLEIIADKTDKIRRFSILTKKQLSVLSKVDDKIFKAGLLGSDIKGLYKPV